MKSTALIETLANAFGRERVLVHTEHHLQVADGPRKHDVWLGKYGLKWKLAGSRNVSHGSPERLIDRINGYDPARTDLSEMHAALELSRSINEAGRLAVANKITRGVWCDAGFKDGKAQISVVKIDGDFVAANAEPRQVANIHDAEYAAIKFAMSVYDMDDTLPIFSDSRSAVDVVSLPRVRWIPREKNKVADGLANLRGR